MYIQFLIPLHTRKLSSQLLLAALFMLYTNKSLNFTDTIYDFKKSALNSSHSSSLGRESSSQLLLAALLLNKFLKSVNNISTPRLNTNDHCVLLIHQGSQLLLAAFLFLFFYLLHTFLTCSFCSLSYLLSVEQPEWLLFIIFFLNRPSNYVHTINTLEF